MNISNAASDPRRKRWQARLILSVVSMVGLLAVVFIATVWFGLIGGEEFCPQTFARRSFYYYEIPLVGVQVSPITRSDTTDGFSSFLKLKNYIPAAGNATPRWDLVNDSRSGVETSQGDASILCAYLDAMNSESNSYWEKWSEDHPAIAKVLWPAVAEVAREQLYILIPPLIELAKQASNSAQFQKDLDRLVAEQFCQIATIHQNLNDHEVAARLFAVALKRDPANQAAFEGRRASEAALQTAGKTLPTGTSPLTDEKANQTSAGSQGPTDGTQ